MTDNYGVIIVGAGPAGLAAAIYTSRAGVSTAVLEEAVIGGRAIYVHNIDNYLGFPDGISGSELVARLAKQAEKFGGVVKAGEMVVDLDLAGDLKEVRTPSGEYTSKSVIVTTGLKQKKLSIPGEEKLLGRGVSYCATCDGFFFRGRRVAVVGGGNEAASDLTYLASLTKNLLWIPNTDKITADDVYIKSLKGLGVEPIMDRRVVEVVGEDRVRSLKVRTEKGAEETVEVDGLFIAVGTVPTVDILKEAGLKVDEKGFILVNDEMETNVRGVYAAGDCTGTSHQIIVAVGQGAAAGINASSFVKSKNK